MDLKKAAKRAGYLALFAAVAYAAMKTTTFGWMPSPKVTGTADPALAAELRAHVQKLAVDIGPRDLYKNNAAGIKAAEDYIAARFRALGYKVVIEEYSVAGTRSKNITAVKPGAKLPGETVLVCAHYDTFDNPGADDNASGVAGMLALARLLAAAPLDRTVKFASFPNEEPPCFRTQQMGSAVWASSAAARGERIAGVVNLEMIGYFSEKPRSQKYPPLIGPFRPNRANFIAQVSNFASRDLARTLDSEFRKNSGLPLVTIALPRFVPGTDYSDHRNFWDHGYPAVMFTDTSFYRNANYHKPTDLPETLNYDYMALLVAGLKPGIEALAKAP